MRRFRVLVVVIVVATAVPLGLDAAIATNTLRLGPTFYDLPVNAMSASILVRWVNQSSNGTLYDYYTILITITNNVTDSSVRPYGLDVRVPLPDAGFWGWWPENPYFASQQRQITADDGEPLLLPAGQFTTYANPANVGQGTSVMHWVVDGVSAARIVPVMDYSAQFYLSHVLLPRGSVESTNATITLTWDYHSSLQTYPVASRTVIVSFTLRSDPAST